MKAPGADLDVQHQCVEPRRELLGEDRGDDQRDRLDGAGGVADRVEAPVGGRELGGLADDRAAGVADRRAAAIDGRAACRSPGWSRACRACRRCGRARGRRSSAPRRRRPRRSARAEARPCRPRRRSSACRATGPVEVPPSSTSPERVIALVSATRSRGGQPAQERSPSRSAPTWASGERAVGDALRRGSRSPRRERVAAVALAADELGRAPKPPQNSMISAGEVAAPPVAA